MLPLTCLLRRTSLPISLALLLLPSAAHPAVAADPPGRCATRPLSLSGAFSSAVQTPDGDLLIADYNNERLLEIGLPSGAPRTIGGVTGEFVELQRPVSLHRVGNRLWLERSTPELEMVSLGADLRVDRVEPPRRLVAEYDEVEPAGDRDELRALWMWEPLGDDEIVACGRILYKGADPRSDNSNRRGAFVRYSLDDPGDLQLLQDYDIGQMAALACRLKLPVIATLGETAFILGLEDEGAAVYASRPGAGRAQRLEAVPERFARPFQARTENPDVSQVPELLADLSRMTIPAGLFAWEDALYLLSRSWDERTAERSWWLTRIAVEEVGGEVRAEIGATVRIDSEADHLMVVPGDRHWALIEKGPVLSFFLHPVQRVTTVPAERLREEFWRRAPDSLCGSAS